jgi:hypothetical protein
VARQVKVKYTATSPCFDYTNPYCSCCFVALLVIAFVQ